MELSITFPRSAPITDMVLGYDGTRTYLSMPQILLGQPLAAFSLELWVNLGDGTKPASIWANDDGSFELFFQPVIVTPPDRPTVRLALTIGTAAPVIYVPIFKTSVWYYVVVVYDSATATTTLYVDAAPYSASALPSAPPISMGPARVGASKRSGEHLQGAIGQIRIWRGMLGLASVKQLQYLWLTGAYVTARDAATLVANWHTNEGYGDFAFDYTGIADASLGDSAAATRPVWQVSTILKPPDFITFPPVLGGVAGSISVVDLTPHEPLGPSLLPADERETEDRSSP